MISVRVKFFHIQSDNYQGSTSKTIVMERILQVHYKLTIDKIRDDVASQLDSMGYNDKKFNNFSNEEDCFTGRGIISITI